MTIEPKNAEQIQAIAAGIDFLANGNPAEWLVIGGKAGTGKTTIAQAILNPHINKTNILICALSHKAKLVISEKLAKAYGGKTFVSKSIAGALGMNMDNETGNFVLNMSSEGKKEPAIKKANIIIVDEGSMVNEESHRLIMSEKKPKAKVIYLGDIRQLPPIREKQSEFCDMPSPVFYGPNFSVLKERIRQGEESAILPFADYFGDNSRVKYPVLNPVPQGKRQNVVNDKGALVFADNTDDVIEMCLPLYKYAVDNNNMNVIKMVTYRNETRRNVNNMVREYVFGRTEASQQFIVGDLLMFHDNFTIDNTEEPISNSFEIQVKGVKKSSVAFVIEDWGNTTNIGKIRVSYMAWEIEFIYESKPVSVKVLDRSEVDRHAKDVSRAFDYAKKIRTGTERTEALSAAWGLKKGFAPIEYSYAITSHKSQGSTYNTVIVDERDIMGVNMTSNKSKSQSMYTAITRALTTCIVIDGSIADESLKKAIELSISHLVEEPTKKT